MSETVYFNLINRAQDYVYIFTPYLILDNEMLSALGAAAKTGVDVRIITPHVPDKRLVHGHPFVLLPLLQSGVKILSILQGLCTPKPS